MHRYASRLILAAFLLGACGGDDDDDEGTGDDDDGVVGQDAAPQPDAGPPGGTISMTWALYNGDVVTTCEEAGASQVTIALVRQGEVTGEADVFNCSAARASTREIQPATYDMTVDLVNEQGDSLLAEPEQKFGLVVELGRDRPAGMILFGLQ
jgi:hypothetical protein